jgi:hypothetical protein
MPGDSGAGIGSEEGERPSITRERTTCKRTSALSAFPFHRADALSAHTFGAISFHGPDALSTHPFHRFRRADALGAFSFHGADAFSTIAYDGRRPWHGCGPRHSCGSRQHDGGSWHSRRSREYDCEPWHSCWSRERGGKPRQLQSPSRNQERQSEGWRTRERSREWIDSVR